MANDAPLTHADPTEHRRQIALRANSSLRKGPAPGTEIYGAIAPQTITGPGAIALESAITNIITTGADAFTLADGFEGQVKLIILQTFGGAATLTPANLTGGTTITFNAALQIAQLIFTGGSWLMISGSATIA